MNHTKIASAESQTISAKGRWKKFTGIALVASSIVGLVVTPTSIRWLILLEGLAGLAGLALFVYSRIQFWREVNKLRT